MTTWMNLLLVVHVLIGLSIVGLVLLQHGKGADMGSGFGGGSASSLFGATGSANFLSRTTAVLATVFFISSLGLGYLATNRPGEAGGVMDRMPAQKSAPAAPAGEAQKPAAEVPQPPAPAPSEKSVPQ